MCLASHAGLVSKVGQPSVGVGAPTGGDLNVKSVNSYRLLMRYLVAYPRL